jgi:predicted Zn-dependent protease
MRFAALGALLVCAWFVLGVVQASSTDAAREELNGEGWPDAARAARVDQRLDRAAALNPDTTVEKLRAQLAGRQGDRALAQRILEAVVREHPDDIDAWARLLVATNGRDETANARARAAIRRLSPPVD